MLFCTLCWYFLVVVAQDVVIGDVMFVTNLDPPGIYSSPIDSSGTSLEFTDAIKNVPLQRPVALDYNANTATLYWSDVSKSTIEWYSLVTDERDVLVSFHSGVVDGLAIDAIGNKLYWTSENEDRIEVINLDGTNRTILFDTTLEKPRAIEVDPAYGYLYWTDWGTKTIERAKLNNLSSRTALVTTGLLFPNGLVLAVPDGKVYWCDAGTDVIEEANLDGTNRRRILDIEGKHPFGIEMYENYLYWSDWTDGIYRVDRRTGIQSKQSSDFRLTKPGGLHIHTETCMWKNEQNFCYPGTCNSFTNSCNCHPDFNMDINCMAISVESTVTQCSVVLYENDDDYTAHIPCHNTLPNIPAYYSSLHVTKISVIWHTKFTGPPESEYPYPYYISDFKVGVIAAAINWTVNRENYVLDAGNIDCNLNYSRSYPNENLHTCDEYAHLEGNLQSGDSLVITTSSTNGGFLNIIHDPPSSIYYEGKSSVRYLDVVVDFNPPTHCSVSTTRASTCAGNALEISDRYTKSSELRITWSAWFDAISGVSIYNAKVCKMIPFNRSLDVSDECITLKFSQPEHSFTAIFNPTSPGVYCVVLSVNDSAGNTRNARRCFIFDNQSEISFIDDSSIDVIVGGVKYANNSEVKINGNKQNKVMLSWEKRFQNKLHVDEGFLLAIETIGDVFEETYDSNAQPPGRPLSAIPNKEGIMKFEYLVTTMNYYYFLETKNVTDVEKGDELEQEWTILPNNKNGMVTIELRDIDYEETLIFFVKATDVIGNTKTDFVTIRFFNVTNASDTTYTKYKKYIIILGGTIPSLVFILFLVTIILIRRCKPNGANTKGTTDNSLIYQNVHYVSKNTIYQCYKEQDENVYESIDNEQNIYETCLL
ncbi:uncharacterized protein [Antedon mediterranea]|uniref:uncharacterized protein n=1 Tax=Antedon mediterranea TaxID=105859 RepID=UPI003AF5D147